MSERSYFLLGAKSLHKKTMPWIWLGIFCFFTVSAQAATIRLVNGDRLTGDITAFDSDSLELEHPVLGRIRLYNDAIANKDALRPELQTTKKEAKNKGEWSGTVNLGGTLEDGRTNAARYAFEGKLEFKKAKNRYSLEGLYNYGEANGFTSSDNLNARGQYDRFFSMRWYGYGNSSYFSDSIAQIKRRIAAGVGTGYQFFDTYARTLKIELGINKVHESRQENILNYPGSRWFMDYNEHLWRDKLILFHNQEGFWNLEETENVTIRSRNGLKLPLLSQIYTTAQVNIDFDGNPGFQSEYVTSRYILAIGYNW